MMMVVVVEGAVKWSSGVLSHVGFFNITDTIFFFVQIYTNPIETAASLKSQIITIYIVATKVFNLCWFLYSTNNKASLSYLKTTDVQCSMTS